MTFTDRAIYSPSSYPLNLVCLVRSTFANGVTLYGTGAFVGPNDVLTASHVVYSPEWGAAVQVSVDAGYGYLSSGTHYNVSSFRYFTVGQGGGMIAYDEVDEDVALLTTTTHSSGWFGMIDLYSNYSVAQNVDQSGYDSQLSEKWLSYIQGLSEGNVSREPGGVWNISQMGVHPGDSGSPVWIDLGNGPQIFAVVSTAEWGAALDADTYSTVRQWIAENDSSTPGGGQFTGTTFADRIRESELSTVSSGGGHRCTVNGGEGIDTLQLEYDSSRYSVTHLADGTWQLQNNTDGVTYTLSSVERLDFASGSDLALDGSAAMVYRLYQAALGRTPDLAGLGYWLAQADSGMQLQNMADHFIASNEFRQLYGSTPSNEAFVTACYHNVLGRSPDSGGFDWWLTQLKSGQVSRASLLASMSDSAENIAMTGSIVATGVWYQAYDVGH